MPWRGLAFRILEPYPGFKTFRLPFHFVDRRKGTQRRLETSTLYREQSFDRMGMEERNGFLLICGYRPYVYDLSTGEQIFDPPGDVQGPVVWMKRPAPAFVDTAGLRRLQARFR